MRRLRSVPALALIALPFVVPGRAVGAPAPPSVVAAREVLVLTRERLSLMDEVMAAKWFSRTPIQDPAQEAVVIEGAVAKGRELGVARSFTRGLFEAEIAAAKEVELGWGSEWLCLGAPPGLAAPELGTLRAELGAISGRIVAVLPRLAGLTGLPEPEPPLRRAAARILRVPHLGRDGRLGIVQALFG